MATEAEREKWRKRFAARYARPEARAKILERNRKREGEREYGPEEKKRKAANARKYRSDPELRERHLARAATKAALVAGKITRGPCAACSCGSERVEAHHEDYSQPLWVIWLCRRHHKAYHADRDTLAKAEATAAITRFRSNPT